MSNLLVLSELAIFAVTLLIFLQKRLKRPPRLLFLLMGISFLSLAYVNLLINLGLSLGFVLEFRVIQALVWSSLLTVAVSEMTGIRRLKHLLLLTIGAVIFVLLTPSWLVIAASLSYYIAALSFFLLFILSKNNMKNAGFIGLLSVMSSNLLLYISGILPSSPLWLLPDLLLVISLLHFVRVEADIDSIPSETKIEALEGRDFWKPLGYILAYTFLMNISILITTTVLHELGHSLVGSLMGCQTGNIILTNLFQANPEIYRELACAAPAGKLLLGLGGFSLALPFGLFFFLLRKFPERNFSIVILGISALLSGIDFQFMFKDALLPYVPILSGIALIIYGEISFINDNTKPPTLPQTQA